jgi:hypothetical protein
MDQESIAAAPAQIDRGRQTCKSPSDDNSLMRCDHHAPPRSTLDRTLNFVEPDVDDEPPLRRPASVDTPVHSSTPGSHCPSEIQFHLDRSVPSCCDGKDADPCLSNRYPAAHPSVSCSNCVIPCHACSLTNGDLHQFDLLSSKHACAWSIYSGRSWPQPDCSCRESSMSSSPSKRVGTSASGGPCGSESLTAHMARTWLK